MAKREFRARKPASLGRFEAFREPYPRVLIVCEGECTEPYYLDGMRRDLGLPNIRVEGKRCGSDPLSVVKYALACFDDDPNLDKIFCVFDRDNHATFDEAIRLIREVSGKSTPIESIASYPSFEFWYLLHFAYSRKPFAKQGKRSPAEALLADLAEYFPSYKKSKRDIWEVLKDNLQQALKNGEGVLRQADLEGELNPSTEVVRLVSYLLSRSGERR